MLSSCRPEKHSQQETNTEPARRDTYPFSDPSQPISFAGGALLADFLTLSNTANNAATQVSAAPVIVGDTALLDDDDVVTDMDNLFVSDRDSNYETYSQASSTSFKGLDPPSSLNSMTDVDLSSLLGSATDNRSSRNIPTESPRPLLPPARHPIRSSQPAPNPRAGAAQSTW